MTIETFYTSSVAATRHMWSTQNTHNATEKMKFKFYFIVMNFNLNTHMLLLYWAGQVWHLLWGDPALRARDAEDTRPGPRGSQAVVRCTG